MTNKEKLKLLRLIEEKMKHNTNKMLLYKQFLIDCCNMDEMFMADIWTSTISRLSDDNNSLAEYAKRL